MRRDADHEPLIPMRHHASGLDRERVDLDDPAAVKRAIGLHQAGKAVLAVPFGSVGYGTLTWLDPRGHETHAENSERQSVS